MPTIVTPIGGESGNPQGATLEISSLSSLPPALLNRVIRRTARDVFDASMSSVHTNSIARLITDWHGQSEVHVPGIRVERQGAHILMTASSSTPTEA
jgi:tRNA(Ile)-lysidine synthase